MRPVLGILIFCAAAVAQGPLSPGAAEWKSAAQAVLALHRTPPLYPTDSPAANDVQSVQVRVLHVPSGHYVRLEWNDRSRDSATLAKAERVWQGEHLVNQSPATDRFSDACAVMVPERAVSGDMNPSLQMGDATHPVRIYFWDATRGAALMQASGRETTKRTGQGFPSEGQYADGKWTVVLQVPELQPGAPFAVAIWNGSQQDRDGRKNFSKWYRAQ